MACESTFAAPEKAQRARSSQTPLNERGGSARVPRDLMGRAQTPFLLDRKDLARFVVRMPTVADLASAMESIAPLRLAESWDNVGLLVGDPSLELSGVLLAIDCTREV